LLTEIFREAQLSETIDKNLKKLDVDGLTRNSPVSLSHNKIILCLLKNRIWNKQGMEICSWPDVYTCLEPLGNQFRTLQRRSAPRQHVQYKISYNDLGCGGAEARTLPPIFEERHVPP
jgi:hypothetical protein